MDIKLIAEIIGWLGNIAFLAGAVATAKKHKSLFIGQFFGNFWYTIQALILVNYSLLILSIILIIINIYGWINWSKNEGDNK